MDSERGTATRDAVRRLRAAVRSPEVATDALQIVKCTIAATFAWWISKDVVESPLPFLAPWTALMTVHATVYRSLSRGVQMMVASAIGVALSFTIGHYLGVSLWTFALALLIGLIGSRLTWMRDEGVAIATTAVFVLGSGFGAQAPLLDERMIEVAIGVLVGVVVNLALVPPLRHQQAELNVASINQRMGDVLINMADDLETSWDTSRADSWLAEAVALDEEFDAAWETVRFAQESERMNPRQSPGTDAHMNALVGVGEGISHLRHLTRTVRETTYAESRWDAGFRSAWVGLVRDTGLAIQTPEADVAPIQARLDELAQFAMQQAASGEHWPIYGSLITSMRHIAIVVVDARTASHQ